MTYAALLNTILNHLNSIVFGNEQRLTLLEKLNKAHALRVYERLQHHLLPEEPSLEQAIQIENFLRSLFSENSEESRFFPPTTLPISKEDPWHLCLKDLISFECWIFDKKNREIYSDLETLQNSKVQLEQYYKSELDELFELSEELNRLQTELNRIKFSLSQSKQLFFVHPLALKKTREDYDSTWRNCNVLSERIQKIRLRMPNTYWKIIQQQQFLESLLAESPSLVEVFFPNLAQKHQLLGKNFTEEILHLLKTHILSDDRTHLIPIRDIVDWNKRLKQSLNNWTPSEQSRLKYHSIYTEMFIHHQEVNERKQTGYLLEKERPLTLRDVFERLAFAYLKGGIRGAGNETEATEIAQVETERFISYALCINSNNAETIMKQKQLNNYLIMQDIAIELRTGRHIKVKMLFDLIESLYKPSCIDQKLVQIEKLLQEKNSRILYYLSRKISIPQENNDTLYYHKRLMNALLDKDYPGNDRYPLTLSLLETYDISVKFNESMTLEQFICLINASNQDEVLFYFQDLNNIRDIQDALFNMEIGIDNLINIINGLHHEEKCRLFLSVFANKYLTDFTFQNYILGKLAFIVEAIGYKNTWFLTHLPWETITLDTYKELFRYIARCYDNTLIHFLLYGQNNIKLSQSHLDEAFFIAIEEKNYSLLSLLIEAGANPDGKSNTGLTPAMLAVLRNDLALLKRLKTLGADMNAGGIFKVKPLFLAASLGLENIINYFEFLDEDMNQVNCKHENLVHIAAFKGNLNLLKLLEQKNVNFHALNIDKQTPLFSAILGEDVTCTQYLISKGLNVNQCDISHMPPAYYAVKKNLSVLLEVLAVAGATLEDKLNNGMSLLAYAICEGNKEVIQFFLKRRQLKGRFDLSVECSVRGLIEVAEAKDADIFQATQLFLQERGLPAFSDMQMSISLAELATLMKEPQVLKELFTPCEAENYSYSIHSIKM